MSNSSSSSSGIGLPSLLGVTFIVLKLTHVIAWSWWWVLAPFWIGWSIAIVMLVLMLVFAVFVTTASTKTKQFRR